MPAGALDHFTLPAATVGEPQAMEPALDWDTAPLDGFQGSDIRARRLDQHDDYRRGREHPHSAKAERLISPRYEGN
eukprot:8745189-Ditylum_brightwellii.AAC.1